VLTYKSEILEGFKRWMGGGGGPLWLQEETRTIMGPTAYQNTVVLWTRVNKIPQNFHTLSATSL